MHWGHLVIWACKLKMKDGEMLNLVIVNVSYFVCRYILWSVTKLVRSFSAGDRWYIWYSRGTEHCMVVMTTTTWYWGPSFTLLPINWLQTEIFFHIIPDNVMQHRACHTPYCCQTWVATCWWVVNWMLILSVILWWYAGVLSAGQCDLQLWVMDK